MNAVISISPFLPAPLCCGWGGVDRVLPPAKACLAALLSDDHSLWPVLLSCVLAAQQHSLLLFLYPKRQPDAHPAVSCESIFSWFQASKGDFFSHQSPQI